MSTRMRATAGAALGVTAALVLGTAPAGAVSTAATSTAATGAATPSATGAGPTSSAASVTTLARLVDDEGRPVFVEVERPTVAEERRAAAAMPGSVGYAVETPVSGFATAYDDTYRSRQWHLDTLHAEELPAVNLAGTRVAVVDSGVRASHEDFGPAQVRCDLGADFSGDGLSSNGCVDPVGHGTHVAGVIGARANNRLGVAGVAPGVEIIPVRVLGADNRGTSLSTARGIVHAADMGADVINLSLGGPYSTVYDDAVAYAVSRGATIVVAAGNNRLTTNSTSWPAASPGALAVAATDSANVSAAFSHSGPSVDISAPGVRIASTYSGADNAYAVADGTSMAAPTVAAVAALYRAQNQAATKDQVDAALIGTATDLEAPGRDDNTGAGLVDAYRLLTGRAYTSVTSAPAPAPVPAPAPTPVAATPTPTPAPTAPALKPAPVAKPAPLAKPVVKRVAKPTANIPTRVRSGVRVSVPVTELRPGSTVTLTQTYTTKQRVRSVVVRGGKKVVRWTTRTVTKSPTIGSAKVGRDGRASVSIRPLRGVKQGTFVVRGVDRNGKKVALSARFIAR